MIIKARELRFRKEQKSTIPHSAAMPTSRIKGRQAHANTSTPSSTWFRVGTTEGASVLSMTTRIKSEGRQRAFLKELSREDE